MLFNYHIGCIVLGLLWVGVRVRFGWGGIRAAGSYLCKLLNVELTTVFAIIVFLSCPLCVTTQTFAYL